MSFENLMHGDYFNLTEHGYDLTQKALGEREVERLFTYYDGTPAQTQACIAVRDAFKKAALSMVEHCPHNQDRTAAVRQLRAALQMAIASIVIPPER